MKRSSGLSQFVQPLHGLASAATLTHQMAHSRMSLLQFATFLQIAHADAKGTPTTLKELVVDKVGSTVHNGYLSLLKPSRRHPDALGWVEKELDPNDLRSYHLRLTPIGKQIALGVCLALTREPELAEGMPNRG